MRATAAVSGRNDGNRWGNTLEDAAISSDGRGRRGGGSVVRIPCETIVAGSNGRYYTEWQVERRLRTGQWRLCMRQRTPDRRLVETADEALLLLAPTDPDELPPGIEIRVFDGRVRVVDTRGGRSIRQSAVR